MMSGNERLLMNNIAISALISLLLSFLLIPHYGITGAAIATAMSVIVRNIMASYLVYKAMNIVTVPWPGFKIR
jgi:O-antigen/teichoic acid export membrane protein